MEVREAVESRYSCRAFLKKPVPKQIVREIIERAARAPSAGNMQPWRVYVLSGDRIEALKADLAARTNELPKGEGNEYQIYPEPMVDPYRQRRFNVGELLYESINIAREDKAARYRQYAKNYQFFGAPVAIFIALERSFGLAQWADVGGYLQTVILLARAYGLHTCPQQAWVSFHKTVRAHLNLPENLIVYSGIAMGYADTDASINSWRSPREPLEAYATFMGFD
jgi:nitroreductase